jgi:hypothetical protein
LTVDWIRMTPYAGPGTFLSRSVDAGGVVNWGTLAWEAQTPSGTSIAFSVRRGDVAVPDATWTAFESVAVSGGSIGGSSRYLQYRVELTSSDPASTPAVEQVSIAYSGFPPNRAPVAAAASYSGPSDTPLTVGAPGVLAHVTDADGDPLTAILVAGPSHGTMALQASGAFTYTPAANFAGPDAFSYMASDGTENSNVAVVSIVVGGTLVTVTDTTSAEFGAGTVGEQTAIAQTVNGEVILRPAAGSEFDGSALMAGWAAGEWNPAGSAVVAGGTLTLDGAWAGTVATYPAGRSIEFVATFSGAPYQHAGFGETFDAAPWAIISTFQGGGLFARTASGSGSVDTPLSSELIGSPHRFRIDWTPDGVIYSVDGTVVASHSIALDVALRPLASDFTVGEGALVVDWMRMTPFASSGTFLSRVFDAASTVSWGTLEWAGQVLPGSTVAVAVRHGDTPVPDASWTAFAPIAGSGGPIGASARYLQYRAELVSGDQASTPSIAQVSISYWVFP